MSLLLQQTRSKLDALLRTIEGLRTLDYPFTDPVRVLDIIRDHFSSLRADVAVENSAADPETIRNFCRTVLQEIQNYLPVLGFISRSSDLEAPVELHGPLVRLTRKAIQSDVRLVIFSEWNYSPFTFLFPELAKHGVVLVGMPRSESHNALISSLAGHELGHNIWQKESLGSVFQKAALEIILEEMKSDWILWGSILKLKNPEQLSDDLFGFGFLELPLAWALRQCEETFCDLMGLLLFREAYLHAFQYLLAPGDSARHGYHYPELRERARVLVNAARTVSIWVPEQYEESFEKPDLNPDGPAAQHGALADKTCSRLVEKLFETAKALVLKRELCAYSEDEVSKAKASLKRAVPMTDATGIENILIAAWQLQLEGGSFLDANLPAIKTEDTELVLNELVLKSFEVFEIEQRVGVI